MKKMRKVEKKLKSYILDYSRFCFKKNFKNKTPKHPFASPAKDRGRG